MPMRTVDYDCQCKSFLAGFSEAPSGFAEAPPELASLLPALCRRTHMTSAKKICCVSSVKVTR